MRGLGDVVLEENGDLLVNEEETSGVTVGSGATDDIANGLALDNLLVDIDEDPRKEGEPFTVGVKQGVKLDEALSDAENETDGTGKDSAGDTLAVGQWDCVAVRLASADLVPPRKLQVCRIDALAVSDDLRDAVTVGECVLE